MERKRCSIWRNKRSLTRALIPRYCVSGAVLVARRTKVDNEGISFSHGAYVLAGGYRRQLRGMMNAIKENINKGCGIEND